MRPGTGEQKGFEDGEIELRQMHSGGTLNWATTYVFREVMSSLFAVKNGFLVQRSVFFTENKLLMTLRNEHFCIYIPSDRIE